MDLPANQDTSDRLSSFARLCETLAIALGGLSIYLMIALASFSPYDPGWLQTATTQQVYNLAGRYGAFVADILFFGFGYVAYSIPFLTVVTAWLCFSRPIPLSKVNFFKLGVKLIGLVLLVFSVCSLAAINADDLYYFSSGGLLGDVIAETMIPVCGLLGTMVVLIVCFAGSITLVTGISWVTIVEWIGHSMHQLFYAVIELPQRWQDWKQGRQHQDDEYEADQLTESTANQAPLPELDQGFSARQEPDLSFIQGSGDHSPEKLEPAATEIAFDDIQEPVILSNPDRVDLATIDLPEVASPSSQDAPTTAAKQSSKSAVVKADFAATPEPESELLESGLPEMSLLDKPNKQQDPISQEQLDTVSRLVEAKLLDFNIQAKVVEVHPGPVITRFELDLAPGVKVSKISGLSKDLARALSAISVRVVEVIPGKSVIGLELPNRFREIVYLSEVIDTPTFHEFKSPLAMVLGKDIAGDPVVVNLAKMPHLLVAGTTGSGKSVGVNVMILSLLYKSKPEDVRMIMIDPKMLELSVYEGIPHLLSEVVTDMKEAANALRWCVGEMERRYKLMSALGVRNLQGYNQKVLGAIAAGEPILDPLWQPNESMDPVAPPLEKLPHIVVVIDEFADMMMIVGKKVEELIARIAQKARAAGIHLILATQRPSVDVITGLIKANIPTRIAFQVSSKIDSRTILDQQGAETLLGMGDMLYQPAGTSVPTRVHGAFVDDHEVHAVVSAWKARGEPNYIDEILNGDSGLDTMLPGEQSDDTEELDQLFDQAVAHITETRRGSVSGVQRKFKIGYNRAARLVEQMEAHGIVSAPGHNGSREVLAPPPVRLD